MVGKQEDLSALFMMAGMVVPTIHRKFGLDNCFMVPCDQTDWWGGGHHRGGVGGCSGCCHRRKGVAVIWVVGGRGLCWGYVGGVTVSQTQGW